MTKIANNRMNGKIKNFEIIFKVLVDFYGF